MAGKRVIGRFGVVTMAVLATGVAFYSLRYYGVLADAWLGIDPRLRAVIAAVPVQAMAHILVGPVALLLGPLQFLPGLRATYPRAHRWTGRVYAVACVVSGTAALATAPFASGGPIAGLGYGLLRRFGSLPRSVPGAPPSNAGSRCIDFSCASATP